MISLIEKKLNQINLKKIDENLPQAAVLILIVENDKDYSIVFTERSKRLPSHAGEVSFPGGKKENEDKNMYARWMTACKSPMTYDSWEYGDAYISEIMSVKPKLLSATDDWKATYFNPLFKEQNENQSG